MAKFRADHYLTAEFEKADASTDTKRVLEALQGIKELKDLAVVSRKLEGKQWSEILGRVDIPAGSREFFAMIKKDTTPREPYNLFIRIDINQEAPDIGAARAAAKGWIESEFVPRIRAKIIVRSIRVLQPEELYRPRIS
ncbi:MAG: hypothetical protein C4K47_07580 [Candidatus Thorarchaeota archaeon]|nr:MAG: hypothetical protein C4K47_07580 [Candidatus Thorarchaeota archaeon]